VIKLGILGLFVFALTACATLDTGIAYVSEQCEYTDADADGDNELICGEVVIND